MFYCQFHLCPLGVKGTDGAVGVDKAPVLPLMMTDGGGERQNGDEKGSGVGGIRSRRAREEAVYICLQMAGLTDTSARIALVIGAAANKRQYELEYTNTHRLQMGGGGFEPRESGDLPLLSSPVISRSPT